MEKVIKPVATYEVASILNSADKNASCVTDNGHYVYVGQRWRLYDNGTYFTCGAGVDVFPAGVELRLIK